MNLREKLIEAGADAMVELPFDTLELRDWGKESIVDPARVLSEAALDAMLDVLAESWEEWRLGAWERVSADHTGTLAEFVGALLAVLREDR